MNCAWCGANAGNSNSHGICATCAAMLLQQQAERHKEKAEAQDQSSEVRRS
jgi:hypothetical protein